MDYRAFLIGLFTGVSIASIFQFIRATAGTLRIDHSNPEKDVYRFDIDNIDSLSKKKRILLKVDNNASLSQE